MRILLLCLCLLALLSACAPVAPAVTPAPTPAAPRHDAVIERPADPSPEPTPFLWIDPAGDTVATRIRTPEGYARTVGNAYEEFIRDLPLLPDGSPVVTHEGEISPLSGYHAAVIDLDVGERDLQQCADAALRIRCEYLFAAEQYDAINYHLTNGDEFPYALWREGYRLEVKGNDTRMVEKADPDGSYESFREYLNVLFNYASTRSLEPESTPISREEMRVGDIFIVSGRPGHCMIVADLCENEAGEKAFLLAQSSMPAQSIHIIELPQMDGPWFRLDEIGEPFAIQGWEFPEGSLRRMP